MLVKDDRGILTIEFSLVFSITILILILILNFFILMYERVQEIIIENTNIMKIFELKEGQAKLKYDKAKRWERFSFIDGVMGQAEREYGKQKFDSYKKENLMKKIFKEDYEEYCEKNIE